MSSKQKTKEFKTDREFIDWVYSMHLQNTNGRETHDEMFKLGIEACLNELKELKLLSIPYFLDKAAYRYTINNLIAKYEDKIECVENLKNTGGSTWGSESPTKAEKERFDVRIYEGKTFIEDLRSLLNKL